MPNATLRSVARLDSLQVKAERAATVLDSTISVPTGSTVGYEIVFARIPTRARIHGISNISNDALGAGTLNLGLKAVAANFTTSATALNSALAVTSAANNARVINDHANNGKMAWELLGLSSDPGGFADVIGTTATATTSATGDVTLALVYSVD